MSSRSPISCVFSTRSDGVVALNDGEALTYFWQQWCSVNLFLAMAFVAGSVWHRCYMYRGILPCAPDVALGILFRTRTLHITCPAYGIPHAPHIRYVLAVPHYVTSMSQALRLESMMRS